MLQSSSLTWIEYAPFWLDNCILSKMWDVLFLDMTLIYLALNASSSYLLKVSLHHRSLKIFISLEISWTKPPPLHPYLSSYSFKIIFIISSRFYFLHKTPWRWFLIHRLTQSMRREVSDLLSNEKVTYIEFKGDL